MSKRYVSWLGHDKAGLGGTVQGSLACSHACAAVCPARVSSHVCILISCQLPPRPAVMEFIGENGTAAPRLKDAGLPPSRMRQAYTGATGALWSMAAAPASRGGLGVTRGWASSHDILTLPPMHDLPSAEMLLMVRNLYQKCRLVHADLSGGYRCCCRVWVGCMAWRGAALA